MNTQSNDVVKTADLNSNEQQTAVKPIIVSRRRLLRAGVAGIPVMLTMAGVAPGEGIKGVASAASGLVYGGDGVGVRARFEGTNKVSDDNLVWSDANGFVVDRDNNFSHFTETFATSAVSGSSDVTLSNGSTGEDEKTLTVKVEGVTASDKLKFTAYLHKTGNYYTDFIVSGKSLEKYFKSIDSSNIKNFITITKSDSSTDITESSTITVDISELLVAIQSDSSKWVSTNGYTFGTTSGTVAYYTVPDLTSDTVAFKVSNFKIGISYTESSTTYTGNVTLELTYSVKKSSV